MTDEWQELLTPGVIARFWAKVDKSGGPDSCWPWLGAYVGNHGQFKVAKGFSIYAHIVSFVLANGPIRTGRGHPIDHDETCVTKGCTNPKHLHSITDRENALKSGNTVAARNALKTHCPQGHPYSGDNLYLDNGGGRYCKECHRIRQRKTNC